MSTQMSFISISVKLIAKAHGLQQWVYCKFVKVVHNYSENKHLFSKESYNAKLMYVNLINYNTST